MVYNSIRHNMIKPIAIHSLTYTLLLMLEVGVNRGYVAPCGLHEPAIIIVLNRKQMSYESVADFVTRVM